MDENKIAIFRSKNIRRVIHRNQWWFVINDVIEVLTDSRDPAQYFKRLKERDEELAKITNKGVVQIVPPLMLDVATEGGKQKMYCWNTEGIFRLIQSIPSPKAEPFKRWLAKVGYERVEEINDPELAQKRARALYKIKGYTDDWIERRMRSIAIREELTDEWKKHHVVGPKEYEILTAEISRAAFGITPSQHKKVKGLQRQNLRDHMTDLELLFSTLGEAATKEIVQAEHPIGFVKNKNVSRRGGNVAGIARKELEKQTGKKIISQKTYLDDKGTRIN